MQVISQVDWVGALIHDTNVTRFMTDQKAQTTLIALFA